jgi:shikimate kinase
MNIYLSGLIGAGKTTVGYILAARLGWHFADLDEAMQKQAGKDFRAVVAEEGWLGFREREYAICKDFARLEKAVVALGGGTVRYAWNRDVLRGTGPVVFLMADLPVLAERVRAHDRPRVNPGSTLEEDLARIWRVAGDQYLGFADLVYANGPGRSPEQAASEILSALRERQLLRA